MMSLLAEPLDFETKVAFDIASQESLSEIPCLEPFFLANLKFRFFLLGGEQTCEKDRSHKISRWFVFKV